MIFQSKTRFWLMEYKGINWKSPSVESIKRQHIAMLPSFCFLFWDRLYRLHPEHHRQDGPHQANRSQVHWRKGPQEAVGHQGCSQVCSGYRLVILIFSLISCVSKFSLNLLNWFKLLCFDIFKCCNMLLFFVS